MKRTAVRITRRHLRSFVTMDQLAAAVGTCRSAVEAALRRFKKTEGLKLETKKIRTGKRGPATKAFRVAEAG